MSDSEKLCPTCGCPRTNEIGAWIYMLMSDEIQAAGKPEELAMILDERLKIARSHLVRLFEENTGVRIP